MFLNRFINFDKFLLAFDDFELSALRGSDLVVFVFGVDSGQVNITPGDFILQLLSRSHLLFD